MAEPAHDAGPSVAAPEDRLDSWKEIATYLNRDVTTVQRWEKREGMPVHRHVHDKRGCVYALTEELDLWMQSRRLWEADPENQPEAEIPPVDQSHPAAIDQTHEDAMAPRKARLWLALAAALCLCLLAIAWLAFGHRPIAPAEPRLRSLAVLPLKNLSGDPAQEYFADGMTEEVIGRLSMIRGLRVSVLSDVASSGCASIGPGRGLWLQDPAARQIKALEDELGPNSSIAIDREHY
jgi:hypothetical protein